VEHEVGLESVSTSEPISTDAAQERLDADVSVQVRDVLRFLAEALTALLTLEGLRHIMRVQVQLESRPTAEVLTADYTERICHL
jgi:hypothetical protein